MNLISRRILGFGVISALVSMAFPAFADGGGRNLHNRLGQPDSNHFIKGR